MPPQQWVETDKHKLGGRHSERRAEAKRDRREGHTKTSGHKKGNKNKGRGARVQSKTS